MICFSDVNNKSDTLKWRVPYKCEVKGNLVITTPKKIELPVYGGAPVKRK